MRAAPLLLLVLAACASRPAPADVAVLRSEPTLRTLGWTAEWELEGAVAALERLGLEVRELSVEELESGQWDEPLLVLSNVRSMAPSTAEAVRRHVARGGRILATYMTSYRDAENQPFDPNDFLLADLFGARFQRWVGAAPLAGSLIPADGSGPVRLARHRAMLVRPLEGARILATWDEPAGSPAVIEGPGGIYCGEDLLCPESSDSPEVMAVLAGLVERLLPGRVALSSDPPRRTLPKPPFRPVPSSSRMVRVGLAPFQGEMRLRASGGLSLEGRAAGHEMRVRLVATALKPPAVAAYTTEGRLVARSEEPLRVAGEPYLEVVRLNDNGTYRWAAYRGSLEIAPGEDALAVVDELSLEEYVAGVVPNEVPAWFPRACLEAVAVGARTYAVSHLGRHPGFDLCAEVHCQVYGGLATEAPSTTEAAAATAGQVLTYQGRPAEAFYHSTCGGTGQDASRVWAGKGAGYLAGRADTEAAELLDLSEEQAFQAFLAQPPRAFCRGASRFRWEESYTEAEMQARLEASLPVLAGVDPGRVSGLRVARRDASGRVAELEVAGEGGVAVVRGDAVRWITSGGRIGPAGLNSALFAVERAEGGYLFRGGGWGHGVGLCQEGAAGRARAGANYREILDHYFPGTKCEDLGPGSP